MSSTIVDWGMAGRTAGAMLGLSRGATPTYTQAEVETAAAEGIAAAADYAGLGFPAAPPAGELIGRREWSHNALATIREAAAPLERRFAGQIDAPGPLGPLLRRAAGGALGVEVGVAAGYAAGRVLGQFDFALFGEPRPSRLLFVDENLERAREALGADRDLFLRWVAFHEGTHVVQFECVPWLAPHMRTLAGELIEGASTDIDAGSLAGSLARFGRELLSSPREFVRALLRGELSRLVADPQRRAQLDRLQATMSVIEGHAEYVMDAAAGDDLGELRRRLDERRARRGGLGELIGRLLGMEAKLRQYEQGRAFCDAVAAVDPEALVGMWEAPERLPDLREIEQPRLWLERMGIALPSGV